LLGLACIAGAHVNARGRGPAVGVRPPSGERATDLLPCTRGRMRGCVCLVRLLPAVRGRTARRDGRIRRMMCQQVIAYFLTLLTHARDGVH